MVDFPLVHFTTIKKEESSTETRERRALDGEMVSHLTAGVAPTVAALSLRVEPSGQFPSPI